jgi:hypothetical protein
MRQGCLEKIHDFLHPSKSSPPVNNKAGPAKSVARQIGKLHFPQNKWQFLRVPNSSTASHQSIVSSSFPPSLCRA